ncbi:MAG: hypothetical protein U0930_24810 [Pirellulales bacterium]
MDSGTTSLGGPTDQFYGGDDTDTVTTYSSNQRSANRRNLYSGVVVSANHGVDYWSLYGTNDADSIDASAWTSTGILILGYDGSDTLKGGAGDDDIRGGNDDDTFEGNGGSDRLD